MIDLRLGDCLEVMKTMPDKSVDLCLTDPPYGVGVEYDSFEDNQTNLHNLIIKVMPEILRISKRVVLTCGQTNMWHYPHPTWVMAWVNKAGANMNSWGFTCWQPILCYGKDIYLADGKGARQDIIEHMETVKFWKEKHPCPKPIIFWQKLLERTSRKGETILDPFMGSGTGGVACKNLDRNFIGIEISPEYFEIAQRRINNTMENLL